MKNTVVTFKEAKQKGEKLTMLTAYDYSTAKLIDESGVNSILVGDSLGNVILGYEDTISVTMEDMIHHGAAVARGAKNALVVVDMPFMSYQTSVYDAVVNAGRLMKEGRAGAVVVSQLGELVASAGDAVIGGGCGGRRAAAAIAAAVAGGPIAGAAAVVAVPAGVGEIDVVRHHLGGGAAVAVLVGPIPHLKPTLHHGQTALGEVAADELAGAAPGHHVDPVGGALAGVFVLEIPVHRHAEGGHGGPRLGVAQLGVTGQTAHDDDVVEHDGLPLRRPCPR